MKRIDALPTTHKDPIRLLRELKTKPEKYWIKLGEKRVLDLFHLMAEYVPAYKDFLRKNHIQANTIKTMQDFTQVPLVDKDNYLRSYSLDQLSWGGKLDMHRLTVAATSGSTGEPFYFPREKDQDLQYAATAEMYLRTNFSIHKYSTLYIDGFGMGIWIGGLFTYQAIKLLAERGDYALSIITPGSSKEEIIKAVKNLGGMFDQIIIGGYPPLVKDTLDEGIRLGVNWQKYRLRFVFSAEGFSESFRDYVLKQAGLKNPYMDSLNHYGTVDLGTMAHETPLSILVRRLIIKHSLNDKFFGRSHSQPTLAQFTPELFFFEESTPSQIVCSAFSGLPLTRYDLKDTGGVLTLDNVLEKFAQNGIDLNEEIQKAKLSSTIWNLPFVYIFERRDFTVKLSGANIYPEEIRKGLAYPQFNDLVTGKFTMLIKFNNKQDQYLEINIELKPDIRETVQLKESIQKIIVEHLLKENSEYHYLYNHLPRERLMPSIVCWPYEHPDHFKPGGKQKWVKK